jgi:hypothetical protein
MRPQTFSDRTHPRCPSSWWAVAPREGFTAHVKTTEEPRMRATGISYYSGRVATDPEPGAPMARPKGGGV